MAAIKMDELLVSWLGSDEVYENVLDLIENYRRAEAARHKDDATVPMKDEDQDSQGSPTGVIPPFYPQANNAPAAGGRLPLRRRRRTKVTQRDTWDPITTTMAEHETDKASLDGGGGGGGEDLSCVRDLVTGVFLEVGQDPPVLSPLSDDEGEGDTSDIHRKYLTVETFVRITKDICRFPSFFNVPLYQRVLDLWNARDLPQSPMEVVTLEMVEWFWKSEMEPFDPCDRFFRLVKQPANDFIVRDDFLPFIRALLDDHPGLEFLSSHAEFQEKYAVTVITRIFYCVNKCHSGRITSRQVRRSDLLEAFQQVDEEEDINRVTRYFSYEHFYVLYCRFWELDHDRDYRITREDLLKYGDHSLSHMIVDRIFDAAPRPFEDENPNREYLSYEDFIYFMLSEEDKYNEVAVRYWFACVDVDGDGKLNNMEMRSFYAVQLHRMQCMGHEIVPFEDMLCQMMDMIKPANTEYLVVEDFLQPECSQVSGALFDGKSAFCDQCCAGMGRFLFVHTIGSFSHFPFASQPCSISTSTCCLNKEIPLWNVKSARTNLNATGTALLVLTTTDLPWKKKYAKKKLWKSIGSRWTKTNKRRMKLLHPPAMVITR